ncbi:AAA family ATPase [Sporosarcina sp. 179-K 3D1 HS]|uniref:AAA family ATPase n=1 Tax=Sporosarcina sp. 179-K 3D1 HS TaxID=3232169 RepID=UPI0039A02813
MSGKDAAEQRMEMRNEPAEPVRAREDVLAEAMGLLDSMIGLAEIKSEISMLALEIEGQKKMESRGIGRQKKPMRHMMFSGDAGTGKTEVARTVADILYGIGFNRLHKFVEVDRSDIVGQYIGQTEANMKAILGKAKGGVLFIDEAYALVGEGNDFGPEAINVLIKAMEDERDDLVIILAGYRADMKQLMKMNEGLSSRIPYTFEFPNYTPEELTRITVRLLRSQGFDCVEAIGELKREIAREGKKGSIEGNGRWARNFSDRIVKQHHIRVARQEGDENIGKIMVEDIRQALGRSPMRDEGAEAGLLKIRDEALEELDALVGLSELKRETKRIMNFVAMEQKREALGMKSASVGMHMIFAGPPGTGKTTVARIIGKFLYGVGFLPSSTFIEADRSSIVGRYIGETEANMTKILDRADGGVLFIDEAYALAAGGNNDYGAQAVNILIKAMEDRRDRMVVILAGYEDEMRHLIQMNPGFESRIPYCLKFPEYSAFELTEITRRALAGFSFELTDKAHLYLEKLIKEADYTGRIQGNARWVRNIVDQIRMEQSNRLAEEGGTNLNEITESDIRAAFC